MKSPRKQPVILQILPELGPGGAEQGCIDVAAGIVASGGRAIVVSHGGARVPELQRTGATHISLPVHSKNPFVMWRNAARLRKIIAEHGVDIVHARSRAPAWSAWYACRQERTARFMTTCHAPYAIGNEKKRLYNSSIARGTRVIAISEFVAAYLRDNYRIEPERICLIPRGIPMEKFHPTMVTPERMITLSHQWRIPDGANIIMLPGRLTRWKGHHVMIEAMSKLGVRDDVFGVIIGSDQGRSEYRKELETAIETAGLSGQIRIVDHCNDMPAAYMLAAVVVSASIEPEGFGRVAVEGQAMGRPVIATDHGGAKETVIHGQTGWLVPPGDADAMARAIKEALALDGVHRVMLANSCMTHVAAHFSREQMVDKTLDVYAELLSHQGFQPMGVKRADNPAAAGHQRRYA